MCLARFSVADILMTFELRMTSSCELTRQMNFEGQLRPDVHPFPGAQRTFKHTVCFFPPHPTPATVLVFSFAFLLQGLTM